MPVPVPNLTMLSGLGAAVAIILSVSGACDKAIEQRITSVSLLRKQQADDIAQRVDRLERWQDREAK